MNNKKHAQKSIISLLLVTAFLLLAALPAEAIINGFTGTSPNPVFNVTAKTGYLTADDGKSIFIWGFASDTDNPADPFCPAGGCVQYPGPTLIVNQGDNVTINLTNLLNVSTSMVFPGQVGVTATGGTPGILTNEAAPSGGTVSYSFVASQPGTYTYYSGTRTELQTEMGLFGALIVRPTLGANYAYNHTATLFDREYLFVLSEMDSVIHQQVEFGQMAAVNNTTFFPLYWFINGRAGFDTIAADFTPILPVQPYGSLARMHPGEIVLVRMIGAGRDFHPLHLHGNHHHVIARDGRLTESTPGAGPDAGEFLFTTTVAPGQTTDALFTWTGEGLNWDVYGHVGPAGEIGQACVDAGVPLEPNENLADHCKPIPVQIPNILDLAFGPVYSGSPFLGTAGQLPPGEGGFNPNSGLAFMWHSHSEKELTSNNIFPGGMLTFGLVEHPNVPIP
jgi:FtsP/CotA-like multicopper oxidase with cupredoxin domain